MGEVWLAPHRTSFSPHFVEHSLVEKIFFSFVTLPSSSPLQVYLLKTHLFFSFTHCSTHSSTFAQHILSSTVGFFFLTCTIPNLRFLVSFIRQHNPNGFIKIPEYAHTTEMHSNKPWQFIVLIFQRKGSKEIFITNL